MRDINFVETSDSILLKRISSKKEVLSEDSCDGYFIKSSEAEARKIIEHLKSKNLKKLIAVVGGENAFNRRALEKLKINYLVSPESGVKKDTLKQRDSGLNHVSAKIAARKSIPIVIDFTEVAGLKGEEKAKRIGRIIQNILICRKTNCKLLIASFASDKKEITSVHSRKSFGISLGMSSKQSKECVEF